MCKCRSVVVRVAYIALLLVLVDPREMLREFGAIVARDRTARRWVVEILRGDEVLRERHCVEVGLVRIVRAQLERLEPKRPKRLQRDQVLALEAVPPLASFLAGWWSRIHSGARPANASS
eukprot:6202842-Pleurochrysis_carterae.AAC.2